MKLQSETLPEIDGVPLETLLSNIAENNNLYGFLAPEHENLQEGEVDPDHMTYEVINLNNYFNVFC